MPESAVPPQLKNLGTRRKSSMRKAAAIFKRYSSSFHFEEKTVRAWSKIELEGLLKDKTILEGFLAFLQTQHCSENLLFYLAAEAFSRVFDEEKSAALSIHPSREYLKQGARLIYDRYLSNGDAPKWVCVKPALVDKIRQTIDGSSSDELTSKVFADAQLECKQTLERDCIPRFVKCVLDGTYSVQGFVVDKSLKKQIAGLIEAESAPNE